ncbi:MAG: hypothetical protein QXJ62_05075 [Nitrososphaeria archaeon]
MLNREVDRRYHKHFKDPDRCFDVIMEDAAWHAFFETVFGLPWSEVERRFIRYSAEKLIRCMLKNVMH